MDALIARYLDGALSEQEADQLLQAAATDPHLENELRAYEALLAGALTLPSQDTSASFTDNVMDRITEAARHQAIAATPPLRRPRRFVSSSTRTLALAASLAVLFVTGYRIGQMNDHGPNATDGIAQVEASSIASGVVMPVEFVGGEDGSGRHLQLVRFAAQPMGGDVRSITVAGTFNNWDPEATPMQREGEAWVAYLLLPQDVHQYMFVENGDQWVTDPSASRTLKDGFGNENAILDLML